MNYNLDEDLRASYDKYLYSSVCDFYHEVQLPLEQYHVDCDRFFKGINNEVNIPLF